jgi:hypothetical protein
MMEIDRTVELYTDIHGHSRRYNIFMYGCSFPEISIDSRNNALIKVLPSLLNEKLDAFEFKDCRFALEKEKEATARVVLFKELSILNSFTMEASFFGTEKPEEVEIFEDEEEEERHNTEE